VTVDAPGASIALRTRGQADISGAWGFDGPNPMPTNGRFRIASVTKTFTSALALDLVDRGELRFAATIDRWLPAFPNGDAITVRSLLQHTSGTADMIFDAYPDYLQMLLSDLEYQYTPAEVVDLMAALPPHHDPGRSYRYSNTDYVLLGLVLERVTDATFATLVNDRIATQLGLADTSYDLDVPTELLHGWFDLSSEGQPGGALVRDLDIRDFPNTALISLAYAAGGLTSSLTDLLSWADALYLGEFLSAPMRQELLASPAFEDPAGGRHGLGVFGYGGELPDGDWPAYGHTGNIVESSAFVAAFPRSSTTVAIHTNVLEVPTEMMLQLAFVLESLGSQR
jgi:Beta-lactamase class C and other penicillin binding proteins